jgi:hypothetical protein
MPRKKTNDNEESQAKAWREGELIHQFQLTRIVTEETPLLAEWLDVENPTLSPLEQMLFDNILKKAQKSITGWNEEDLKIKFIGIVLELGQMYDDDKVVGYFDKTISATVEGIKLTVKSDFMLATGILDVFRNPYFHFQEYKPNKNPSGDSMAQLLEAFLIAQVKNNNNKPLYGVEIIGKQWSFVTFEEKSYCVSATFDCTKKEDLLTIIAILRKFRKILYERLMD